MGQERKALILEDGKKKVLQNGDSLEYVDHHSGYKKIVSGKTVFVQENREMRVRRSIRNEGTLVNLGQTVIDG